MVKNKESKYAFARKMRKNPTPAEHKLWELLRRKQLGVKVRQQSMMAGWIVDFYIPCVRLIIEVDGKGHDTTKDKIRDNALMRHGLKTLRFSNSDVIDNTSNVLLAIRHEITLRQL